MTAERYTRQSGALDPERLQTLAIDVAGVGAVGRQVVIQLIAAGARNVSIFDHDRVEEVNLGPQGWAPNDITRRKVEALAEELENRYECEDLNIQAYPQRYPLMRRPEVLFCCVDGIDTRRRIFQQSEPGTLVLDSRVVGDTIQILAAAAEPERERYRQSFFAPEDAFRGTCTTRMSIHVAHIAAGLLVQQLSKWLRDMPLDPFTVFNLLAMEAYHR